MAKAINKILKAVALSTFCLSIMMTCTLQAAEQVQVCGKYQRKDYSWSHKYKLTGMIASGSELNSELNTVNFNSFMNYLIIPWDEGGYSVFEFSSYQSPSYLEQRYEDQNGRPWAFTKGWDFCY